MTTTQDTTTTTAELCQNGLHPKTPENRGRQANGKTFCLPCRRRSRSAYMRRRYRHTTGVNQPGMLSYDYDEMAVKRGVAGDLNGITLTVLERREATRRLTEAGFSSYEIGLRLETTQRTVVRIRAALRQAGVAA